MLHKEKLKSGTKLPKSTVFKYALVILCRYTRLQTVWSLPGHSRQANKGHSSPRCRRRPNGPGRLADTVVQPTTQSAEGCTYLTHDIWQQIKNVEPSQL